MGATTMISLGKSVETLIWYDTWRDVENSVLDFAQNYAKDFDDSSVYRLVNNLAYDNLDSCVDYISWPIIERLKLPPGQFV